MASDTLAVPRLRMLGQAQCETVHRASLEILRRTGVRVHHEGALDLLRRADVLITDTNLARFPAGLVEWAGRRFSASWMRSSSFWSASSKAMISFSYDSICPSI